MNYKRILDAGAIVATALFLSTRMSPGESLLIVKPSVEEILGNLTQKGGKPTFVDCNKGEHNPSGYKIVQTLARCGSESLYASYLLGKQLVASDGKNLGKIVGLEFGSEDNIVNVTINDRLREKALTVPYDVLLPKDEKDKVYTPLSAPGFAGKAGSVDK